MSIIALDGIREQRVLVHEITWLQTGLYPTTSLRSCNPFFLPFNQDHLFLVVIRMFYSMWISNSSIDATYSLSSEPWSHGDWVIRSAEVGICQETSRNEGRALSEVFLGTLAWNMFFLVEPRCSNRVVMCYVIDACWKLTCVTVTCSSILLDSVQRFCWGVKAPMFKQSVSCNTMGVENVHALLGITVPSSAVKEGRVNDESPEPLNFNMMV